MVLNIAMFGVCLDGVLVVQLPPSVLVRTCARVRQCCIVWVVLHYILYDFHVELECVFSVLKMRCDFLAKQVVPNSIPSCVVFLPALEHI